MKDIHAIKGRYYVHRLIEEGEHVHQDFKFAISDARKIARSISAFANNDGGRLLIGVKDNGNVAGVRNEEDIYVIEQAASMYCEPAVEVRFDAYKVEPGVIVIKAAIDAVSPRPVRVREADGSLRAYYRVDDENIVAHPLMVRAWQRRQDDSAGTTMRLDAEASAILAAVDASPFPVSPERLAVAAHLSRRTADEVIVSLAAVGVLDFRYDGHSFGVVRHRASEDTAEGPTEAVPLKKH